MHKDFSCESLGERVLKIGPHLPKLLSIFNRLTFLGGHSVECVATRWWKQFDGRLSSAASTQPARNGRTDGQTDILRCLWFAFIPLVTTRWLAKQVGYVAQLVERRSLTGELSLSCARPAANRWPLMWVNRPLYVSQPGRLSLSSFHPFGVDKWVVICN